MNRELAEFLAADERPEGTMIYPELAGFVFSLCCSPEPIPEQEWLPLVFNDESPAYENDEQKTQIEAEMRAMYADIEQQVNTEQLSLPVYCELLEPLADNFGDEAPVAYWARGFLDGHEWLCDIWEACLDDESDEELGAVLMILFFFADKELAENFASQASSDGVTLEQLTESVADNFNQAMGAYAMIGRSIKNRLDAAPAMPVVREEQKVGRNDDCPCGSGKKFKKCCGQ